MRTFKIMGTAGVIAVLCSSTVAFAQTQTESTPTAAGVERKVVPPTRAQLEKAARLKTATTTAQTELADKVLKERMRIMAMGSTTAERMKAVREEMQAQVKANREEAAKRIAEIKDKQRQDKAQKILSQFGEMNKTWTDKFAAEIEHLTTILGKIQARAATAAANGKDVTAANAAIQAAQAAIATAEEMVTAQAAKAYALDTSTVGTAVTESTDGQNELIQKLRRAYQELHRALFTDLFALRDGSMKLARQAVKDALAELKKVPGVDEVTASSTPVNQ